MHNHESVLVRTRNPLTAFLVSETRGTRLEKKSVTVDGGVEIRAQRDISGFFSSGSIRGDAHMLAFAGWSEQELSLETGGCGANSIRCILQRTAMVILRTLTQSHFLVPSSAFCLAITLSCLT